MKEFKSFGALAAHLVSLQAGMRAELSRGLNKAAQAIEVTAKGEFGHYQPAAGPYEAWPPLAAVTIKDRVRKGFSPNEPLLRTGSLRDSIGREVDGLEAVVGSTSDVMVYQELGTPTIPPRPVLGPAAIRSEDEIREAVGRALVTAMVGAQVVRTLSH